MQLVRTRNPPQLLDWPAFALLFLASEYPGRLCSGNPGASTRGRVVKFSFALPVAEVRPENVAYFSGPILLLALVGLGVRLFFLLAPVVAFISLAQGFAIHPSTKARV